MSSSSQTKSEEFLKISSQFKLGALVTEAAHPVTANLSEVAKGDIASALDLLFQADEDVVKKFREFVQSGRATEIAATVLAAVKNGHQFWLVILAVLCAAISAYYYFKVIQAMYFKEPAEDTGHQMDAPSSFKWLLIFTAAIIIILGIMPGLVIDWLYY